MSATNTFETSLITLIFNNTNIANIGDATGLRGSSAAGSLYISLHTADPTDSGSDASEATYTSYARVAVARSGAGWTISGNNASNAALVSFPQCTGGSNTITHFGIHYDNGASSMLFSGALTASLIVTNGIIPTFAIGDIDTNAD
jgi:hypothetical protein